MNILYVIDSLGVGGAEKILINTINRLPKEVKCILVYLNSPADLIDKLNDVKVYCLGYNGLPSLPKAVIKLRNLIKEFNVDIVHAHLFYSTIISRMACPFNVRFMFSVHSVFSQDVFQNNKLLLIVEKLSYKKSHVPIFVSNSVKEDYEMHIGIKGNSYVLNNFAEDVFFLKNKQISQVDFHCPVRLVSVGNLKSAKNYSYLINVFRELKDSPVTLDIYGEGTYRQQLEGMLKDYQVRNVQLLGSKSNIAELLVNYDVFIMASDSEGFCIAVAEAMAVGLPCLLSDLKTFREVSNGKAVFFDLADEKPLVHFLKNIAQQKNNLMNNAKEASVKAQDYRFEMYINKLLRIYNAVD